MRWSWHGLAALVLAVTLGGATAAVLIIKTLRGDPLTDAGATALTHIGAALAGALSAWLATGRPPDDKDQT